jgi:hypothetical protein
MTNNSGALSTFLRSVESLYPGGIPRALLRAARELPKVAPSAFILFVEHVSDSSDEAAEQKLFQAIVEKGLSLPISSAELIYLRTDDDSSLVVQVKEAIRRKGASCLVGLGARTARILCDSNLEFETLRSKWLEFENVPLLVSYPLSEVADQVSIKRRFWDDLKLVRTKLAGVVGLEDK